MHFLTFFALVFFADFKTKIQCYLYADSFCLYTLILIILVSFMCFIIIIIIIIIVIIIIHNASDAFLCGVSSKILG